MSTAPTPGKHRAIQTETSIGVYAEDGTRLATVKRIDDAVLFAAAGDLLKALEAAVGFLAVAHVKAMGNNELPAIVSAIERREQAALIAIAKAKGQIV